MACWPRKFAEKVEQHGAVTRTDLTSRDAQRMVGELRGSRFDGRVTLALSPTQTSEIGGMGEMGELVGTASAAVPQELEQLRDQIQAAARTEGFGMPVQLFDLRLESAA